MQIKSIDITPFFESSLMLKNVQALIRNTPGLLEYSLIGGGFARAVAHAVAVNGMEIENWSYIKTFLDLKNEKRMVDSDYVMQRWSTTESIKYADKVLGLNTLTPQDRNGYYWRRIVSLYQNSQPVKDAVDCHKLRKILDANERKILLDVILLGYFTQLNAASFLRKGTRKKMFYGTKQIGDIDFFLKLEDEPHPGYYDSLKEVGYKKTAFALTAGYALCSKILITAQIIDDNRFRHKTVEEMFSKFDLINSRYAITFDNTGSKFTLHFDPEAFKADRDGYIQINPKIEPTPFLAHRILKYKDCKGCINGISEESREFLSNWLCKAATGDFGLINPLLENGSGSPYISQQVIKDNQDWSSLVNKIKQFKNEGIQLSNDELILFVDKWQKHKKGANYASYTVDWALDEISEQTNEVKL